MRDLNYLGIHSKAPHKRGFLVVTKYMTNPEISSAQGTEPLGDRFVTELNGALQDMQVKRVVAQRATDSGDPMATIYWWPREWEEGSHDPFITCTIVGGQSKTVLEISNQHGCAAHCVMCGIPAFGSMRDLPLEATVEQIAALRQLKPALGVLKNIPDSLLLSDGGDSLMRQDFEDYLSRLQGRGPFHRLKISTLAIDVPRLRGNLETLLHVVPSSETLIRLQISLLSTNEDERQRLSGVRTIPIPDIGRYAERYYQADGRKLTLSFTVIAGTTVSPRELIESSVDPDKVVIRVHYAKRNGVDTVTGFVSPTVEYLDALVGEFRQFFPDVRYARPDVFTMGRLENTGTLSWMNQEEIQNLQNNWRTLTKESE